MSALYVVHAVPGFMAVWAKRRSSNGSWHAPRSEQGPVEHFRDNAASGPAGRKPEPKRTARWRGVGLVLCGEGWQLTLPCVLCHDATQGIISIDD